jgi:hypothetical protein
LGTVRHQANASSGGQVTDVEIGDFLNGPRHPEQEALLHLIGNSIVYLQGAGVGDEPPAVGIGTEWSDAELTELGNLLVRGLPIEKIARLLGREHGEVRDKVVEIGRACRGSAATNSEPESDLPTNLRTCPAFRSNHSPKWV